MRPILIILILFITLSAKAQKIRFSDTTNEWNVDIPYSGGPCAFCESRYDYKDPIVKNGYTYGLLVSNHYDSVLVREDTLNQKVYAIMLNDVFYSDTSEILLYDYALQTGDTFLIADRNGNFTGNFVDTTYEVLINNTPHKVLSLAGLTNAGDTSWGESYVVIEGIGSDMGPIFPAAPRLFEEMRQLYCFKNNGTEPHIDPAVGTVREFDYMANPIATHPYHNSNTCGLLWIDAIANNMSHEIKTYPNPASDRTTLIFPQTIANGRIELYDMSGRIIFQSDVIDAAQFELIAPPAGPQVFLCRIVTNNGHIYHSRIIFY